MSMVLNYINNYLRLFYFHIKMCSLYFFGRQIDSLNMKVRMLHQKKKKGENENYDTLLYQLRNVKFKFLCYYVKII